MSARFVVVADSDTTGRLYDADGYLYRVTYRDGRWGNDARGWLNEWEVVSIQARGWEWPGKRMRRVRAALGLPS